MQEVRLLGKDSLSFDDYQMHWSGFERKREQGVALVIRNHNSIKIESITAVSPRVMHADLSIGGMALRVVAVYGPTEKANDTEKDKFWRSLRKSCEYRKTAATTTPR